MKYIKLIIITVIILGLSLLLINFKSIYSSFYKNRAESMVVNRMKEKYNIKVDVTRVRLNKYGGLFSSISTECMVEFKYKNKKYYAGVDVIKRNNKVYDNYQFAEINKSFSKYINDNINTKYSKYELQLYNDEVHDHQIKNLIYDYFNGNNYKEVFKDGNLSLTYREIVDEKVFRDLFSDYSKDFVIKVDEYNDQVENMDSGVDEVTCVYKGFTINGDEHSASNSKYRLDFGNIKAYGNEEALKGTNIEKIQPFDLNQVDKYDSNIYRVASDYYRTSCSANEGYIEFYIPGEFIPNGNYKAATNIVNKGNSKYSIDSLAKSETGKYLEITNYCFSDYMEHVILESNEKRNY